MRVRKSATRMAYIRENGWDDLSEGGDGTLISILVTCPLNPEPKAPFQQRPLNWISKLNQHLGLACSCLHA